MTTLQLRPVTEVDTVPAESICLPGRGMTVTELLQVLDLLRRRLARSTRGREGAFAGFDVLDVAQWQRDEEPAHVLFEARLVADGLSTQVVAYAAAECAHPQGVCSREATGEPWGAASGRTVGLGRRSGSLVAPAFPIASPHR